MTEIQTGTQLPDGAIPLNLVEVVSYVDADGRQTVKVRTDSSGECIMLHDLLGLLAFAEHFLVRQYWPRVEVADRWAPGRVMVVAGVEELAVLRASTATEEGSAVGRCGDECPHWVSIGGGPEYRPVCWLAYGHTGMHSDGNATWADGRG